MGRGRGYGRAYGWYPPAIGPAYPMDAAGDIDIALCDASGNVLTTSESMTDDEHIDYTVPGSGTYYILVYFDDAGNSYDLWWDDRPSAETVSTPTSISGP